MFAFVAEDREGGEGEWDIQDRRSKAKEQRKLDLSPTTAACWFCDLGQVTPSGHLSLLSRNNSALGVIGPGRVLLPTGQPSCSPLRCEWGSRKAS